MPNFLADDGDGSGSLITAPASCQYQQSSCIFLPTFLDKDLTDQTDQSSSIVPYQAMGVDQTQPLCNRCTRPIQERYLLKVGDNLWHEQCLTCCVCESTLGQSPSCYVRDGKVFCKHDYKKIFGAKCNGCKLPLDSSDLVHRSLDGVYHAACFTCSFCRNLLQPGDEYVLHETQLGIQLMCRMDYEAFMQSAWPEFKLPPGGVDHRKSPKRPRTILTSQQRKAFKASFELSAKPCRKVREALAKETGLSVRVVQVWFQNQRAKMKKMQRKQEQNGQKSDKSEDQSTKKSDGTNDDGDSKCEKSSTKRKYSTSSTNSSPDSSSDISCQSTGNETFEKSFDDDRNHTPTTSMNPIDRLYSMQDSYFNF